LAVNVDQAEGMAWYAFDDKAAELQGATALPKDECTGYVTIGDKWFALVPVTDVSEQADEYVTCPVETDVMDAETEPVTVQSPEGIQPAQNYVAPEEEGPRPGHAAAPGGPELKKFLQ
jgi:hypothetical protein